MSITDAGIDSDITEAASKLSTLLSQPEAKPPPEVEAPQVPLDPKPELRKQRNTVSPRAQEAPPDEGTSDADEEAEGSESSTLTAPASWDAEAKAKWAKLPDDVKAVITARENDRENATKQRLEEAATIRKRAEGTEAEMVKARDAYGQRLVLLARQLEATIPEEFRGLKSQADLIALSSKDPAAYQRFTAWRDMAGGVVNELRQFEEAKAADAARRQGEILEREAKALVGAWPELADPVKGNAARLEITSTLKGFGFTDEEIGGISDHRILLFAKQFIEGQKALKAHEAAAKKLEGKKLPKVTQPGKGEAAVRGDGALTKAQLHRVANSGDLLATQGALERILSTPQ